MTPATVAIASVLRAPRQAVWARVSTMAGVNAELHPWLHMTSPTWTRGRSLDELGRGGRLFTSTLLALRVIPYDRHALGLERVTPGEGFAEVSTSWTMRAWRHERTLAELPGGETRLVDRLTFSPRVAALAPLATRIVGALFRHRHAQLRRVFGGEPAEA